MTFAATPAAYARAYLCFGIVAILLFAFAIPPWQSPDEPSHFRRADQISRGTLIADRLSSDSGGVVSAGIAQTVAPFMPLQSKPQQKITPEMFGAADPVAWSNSGTELSAFSNTALYPPVLYLPAAAAILVGKLADISILSTLRLARIVNGLLSVAIGAVAIALAGAAAPWIFAVLSLPMTLSLMASASHDGPMFAFAALAAAILFNAYPGGRLAGSTSAFVTMCGAIALVASARPIYAPLAILPLLVSGQSLARRLVAVAVIVVIIGVWARIVSPLVLLQIGNGADPEAQAALLRANPLSFFLVVANTLRIWSASILETFVGVLGWIDTALPRAFHIFAWIELLIALAAIATAFRLATLNLRATVTAAAVLGGALGVFLSLYMVWTRPGETVMTSVHGRYFIPLAVFIPAAICFAAGAVRPVLARAAFAALVVFPPVSIAVALFALSRRYGSGLPL